MKKTLIALSISSLLYSSLSVAEQTHVVSINKTAKADEKMLITGNPYNQSTDEVMSTVSIITRLDIDRIQPKSVAELLQTTAGIDIAANGGPGQATSVFVRGTNSTHTLFLVDGVRIDTVTGSGGASVNDIPTYQIERIEVVKGPRAAMYGSDAVGAVIQIFTRDLASGEYQAAVEYGSNNYVLAGVSAGINHGDGATTFSVSKETSDGYDVTNNEFAVDDDDDSYERVNISLKGHQKLSDTLTLNWVGRYDDGDYDYDGNSQWTATAPSQEYKKYLLSTGLNYAENYWSHDINIAQFQEENSRFGDYPAVDKTTRNQLDYAGVYHTSDALSVNFGTQFYQDDYKGSNAAFSGESRDTLSAFAGALYNRDAFVTELSLRYNDVEDTGTETTYNVSLGYNLNDAIFASINYGTGFKAPTLYQLYDSWSGNAQLKLETSQSWEFLLRGDVYGVKADVSYFNIGFDNLLDYDYASAKYDNIADANISGVEVNLSKSINNLNLATNYTYTDTEDKTTGTQLSRRARHKANISASYDWQKVNFMGVYKYQGTRFDANSNGSLAAYNTVDLGVSYQLNDAWKLQVKANNIFDADYETAPGYVTPGAEYFLQVSFNNL
ncbi:TonB-dependent receptor domain-containing protein [Colwellia ponticola]|uniref:TonB-dependent receptor n=1 Tax=Colwellia ponticola TaxID=2304625 RepID=A0A8H2JLP3_9GAMM|nr:TonB-dependent receptor [Colwellia ponticola]TMM45972.1 TonB-dependent receptor [Colwellia ponticola]